MKNKSLIQWTTATVFVALAMSAVLYIVLPSLIRPTIPFKIENTPQPRTTPQTTQTIPDSVLIDKLNGNKYTPLYATNLWDKMFGDSETDTVQNGKRYQRRGRLIKDDQNSFAIKMDNGEESKLLLSESTKIGTPVYEYDYITMSIKNVRVIYSSIETVRSLKNNTVIVIWYYAKDYNTINKTIKPIEILIAETE